MPYKVIVDHPTIGEGQSLLIAGLGTFKNGTTTEIPDSQVQVYRALHSVVDHKPEQVREGDDIVIRNRFTPRLGPSPVDQVIFGVRVVNSDFEEGEQ